MAKLYVFNVCMRSDKKKKIIIASEIFPPDMGGPATYAYKLAGELASQGFDVSIVTYGNPKNKLQIANCKLQIVNRKIPLPFRYWIYAWKLLNISKGADVVYAQGPLSAGWSAMTVKKITGIRLVVKIVGDQAWERARQFGLTNTLLDEFQTQKTSGKIARIQKIQKEVLKSADDIITVSQWFKGIIVRWGIDSGKINVIHNAVEIDTKFKSQNPNLDLDGDVILTVARLTKWKGIDTLIALMPELLEKNPGFRLVIVGDGPERENLKSQISNLKLEDKVIMTGKLTREELYEYYRRAMMFVLNSGYENWSHVLVEAMNCGVPVIASKEGGNPETVRDGVDGLIVKYNDKRDIKNAIFRILEDSELRNNLAINAKRRVEEYTFSDMVDLTKRVLFG